jgi:probable F420-dependent oxidoreductase
MEIGLILPTIGQGASRESLDAGAEVAAELEWTSVWVTDHLMVPRGPEALEYGTILEAVTSLSYIAARHPGLTIGTSAIIPPFRNSVILAKQLATIDVLSSGRLIVGVGVADRDDLPEFRNLGADARFADRGALVDETIAMWRHLWSGGEPPFTGRFHQLEDYVFQPLPPQGKDLPIWTGGRSSRALRRAAALADGYHAAQTGPDDLEARIPELEELVARFGRPMPTLSVRTRVRPGEEPRSIYTICGAPAHMAEQVRRFADVGTEHLVVVLPASDPDGVREAAIRFHEDAVVPALD